MFRNLKIGRNLYIRCQVLNGEKEKKIYIKYIIVKWERKVPAVEKISKPFVLKLCVRYLVMVGSVGFIFDSWKNASLHCLINERFLHYKKQRRSFFIDLFIRLFTFEPMFTVLY